MYLWLAGTCIRWAKVPVSDVLFFSVCNVIYKTCYYLNEIAMKKDLIMVDRRIHDVLLIMKLAMKITFVQCKDFCVETST